MIVLDYFTALPFTQPVPNFKLNGRIIELVQLSSIQIGYGQRKYTYVVL